MPFPKPLREGYLRFRRDTDIEHGRRRQLAALGQSPLALVIGCSDSRADPREIFDAGPGELFTVRNVANLVPPCEPSGSFHGTSAAIEFAVSGLQVPHIVVLGHSRCGGVRAWCEGRAAVGPRESFIGRWMSILDAAPGGLPEGEATDAVLREMELAAIRVSLTNLRSFPDVAAREADGEVTLHGAYFDIATGSLAVLDEANDTFVPVP